jgi:hypothetical protein
MKVLLLALLLGQATPIQPTKPLSYLVLQGDETEFDAVVADVKHSNGSERTLNIVCQKGCSGKVEFSERIDDFPLGLFRLSDVDDIMVTTWVSGSAYKVRVYSMSNKEIKKVLDVNSISTPTVTTDTRGHAMIVTFASRASGRGHSAQKIWRWRGGTFVSAPR